jgi:hypothetical protein
MPSNIGKDMDTACEGQSKDGDVDLKMKQVVEEFSKAYVASSPPSKVSGSNAPKFMEDAQKAVGGLKMIDPRDLELLKYAKDRVQWLSSIDIVSSCDEEDLLSEGGQR